MASRLAYPEVRAALAAAARNHDLAEADLDDAERAWDGYWASTRPIELSAAVEQRAGQLARTHALRGADAVHLASALAIGDPGLVLAAWDRRLHAARKPSACSPLPRSSTHSWRSPHLLPRTQMSARLGCPSLRLHQVGAPELLVGDRPPLPAVASTTQSPGRAVARPSMVLSTMSSLDLPGEGAGPAPALAAERLVAGLESGSRTVRSLPVSSSDLPVPGGAAAVCRRRAGPRPAGVQPTGLDGADAQEPAASGGPPAGTIGTKPTSSSCASCERR